MLVVELAKTGTTGEMGTKPKKPGVVLQPGDSVGRYVVRKELGAGGMSVVYEATDPDLDRNVAIKVLRSDSGGGSVAQVRLLREAQAMARLSHPNVVTVFEVGLVGDQVFVAMELVVGATLRAWLDSNDATWRQRLSLVLEAGRGLAAVHDSGLVHRDFKPDNVLIGDGRARVTDFGLVGVLEVVKEDTKSEREDADRHATKKQAASLDGDIRDVATARQGRDAQKTQPSGTRGWHAGNELDWALTMSGAEFGTPAYMAPERFQARPCDAKADQFAYCETLYEALYGEHPFEGDTAKAIAASVLDGNVRAAPKDSDVPIGLRRLVLRGLSLDPEDRWPSMAALLARAEHYAVRRSRLWIAVAAALLLSFALAGYAFFGKSSEEAAAVDCARAGGELAGIWDDEVKPRVKKAFIDTGRFDAVASYEAVAKGLDDYTQAWRSMRIDVCEATYVRREQSEKLHDLRVVCLDDRLAAVDALASVLRSEVGRDTLDHAAEATYSLASLDRCADAKALGSQLAPPNLDIAEAVAVERKELARARALELSGGFVDGLSVAKSVVQRATQIDYAPLRAEALVRLGSLQGKMGAAEDAEKSLSEAFRLAAVSDHDAVVIDAAATLAWEVGYSQSRFDDGLEWARHAQLAIESDDPEGVPAGDLLTTIGTLQEEKGQLGEAQTSYETALDILVRAVGESHPEVADVYASMGILSYRLARPDDALRYHGKAHAIRVEVLGAEHPDVGLSLNNLGIVHSVMARYSEAERCYRDALAISERHLGPDHPDVANTLHQIGDLLTSRGAYREAQSAFERALPILEESYGSENPTTAFTLLSLARALHGQGLYPKARAMAQRAHDTWVAGLGPDHYQVVFALLELAREDARSGDHRGAQAKLKRAEAMATNALGTEHPVLAYVYVQTGDVDRRRGAYELAITRVQAGKRILENVYPGPHPDLARADLVLGQTYVAMGRPADGIEPLEDSVAVRKNYAGDPAQLGDSLFALARALWESERDRDRALVLSGEARDAFERAGTRRQTELAEVDAWSRSRE